MLSWWIRGACLLLLFSSGHCTLSDADAKRQAWIIVWKRDVDANRLASEICQLEADSATPQQSKFLNIQCFGQYTRLMNGLAGYFSELELQTVRQVYKDSIHHMVRDQAMKIADDDLVMVRGRKLPEQLNPPWGLDILDQVASGQMPMDQVYEYDEYGTGVHVYVLDTGIRVSHEEFREYNGTESRAFHGYDAVENDPQAEDCHGHGTHVAAIIGGRTFGVAKNVTLHAVRVLDCEGRSQVSTILRGLEWVAQNYERPALVHMSIEGQYNADINSAVEEMIAHHHIQVIVSSGNQNRDACRISPASAPSAVTVAAVDSSMTRWTSSNWGACVDLYAPGVSILSAVQTTDSSTGNKSGTSMAAPFVTGVAALYLETHPGASGRELVQKLYSSALRNLVKSFLGNVDPGQRAGATTANTPNRLLHSSLRGQVLIQPSLLAVTDPPKPTRIKVRLSYEPTSSVMVVVQVPESWNGNPAASLTPEVLIFQPSSWDQDQQLTLLATNVSGGDFHVELHLRSDDPSFNSALHTLLVQDPRPKTGESIHNPRVIRPEQLLEGERVFVDTADTRAFFDDATVPLGRTQGSRRSPDVVYSLTPTEDMELTVSTCGSQFDTYLVITTNVNMPSTYQTNDDDQQCTSDTTNSRIDTSVKAGLTYYIIVLGYNGASGVFYLTVTCTSCTSAPAQARESKLALPTW